MSGGSAATRSVRGMADLFAATLERRQFVEAAFASVTATHGFAGVQTPIVEASSLFTRSLGAASELVRKEMFLVQQPRLSAAAAAAGSSEAPLCLRPEGTLGAVRALVDSGLVRTLPQRVRYSGPFFRHERPQKGRLRQFSQLGVEALAAKSVAGEDAELIAMAARFLGEIGLADALELRINSLGTPAARAAYEQSLLAPFLHAHRGHLSAASQAKLADGRALRVLDSADPADVELLRAAPSLLAALDRASRLRFDNVRTALAALGVRHTLDERLVRGLDYYTHTIFEFVNDDKLGRQQRTALAGGRYDGVVAALGGPKHVASFGWAAGVERLEILLHDSHGASAEQADATIAVVAARADDGAAADERADDGSGPALEAPLCRASLAALALAEQLRASGFCVHHEHTGSLRRQLNRANKLGARAALIVGDRELDRDVVVLRDLATGSEEERKLDAPQLVAHLTELLHGSAFESLEVDASEMAAVLEGMAGERQQTKKA